jgi:thiamine biosynthesis lipoprotein
LFLMREGQTIRPRAVGALFAAGPLNQVAR